MGRTIAVASGLLALVVVSTVFTACVLPDLAAGEEELRATVLADGDPVAVIAPLPDYVSNGTWWTLDGSGSIGVIVSYLWNVTLGNETTFLNSMSEIRRFETLGLYKITLTVTDNQSKTSTAFTAVVSVLDSDQDTLPDWWEEKYFDDLDEIASGDYDGDKYDNLEEYAKGTNPDVKDPRPTFVQMVKENWVAALAIAVALALLILALMFFMGKRLKKNEKAKIQAAIAIEKALESEDK